MQYLVHVANVLFLASYLVRDILWLRVLTVVAILSLVPYYLANQLYAPIAWNAVFIGINLAQLRRLLLERRPVALDARQRRLHQRTLSAMTPRQLLRLLDVGQWCEAKAEQALIDDGQPIDHLRVLCEGQAAVTRGQQQVATLADGAFVGEMGYLTRQPACASVRAVEGATYVQWPREQLDRLLDQDPDIRAALQLAIGADLARKLRAG